MVGVTVPSALQRPVAPPSPFFNTGSILRSSLFFNNSETLEWLAKRNINTSSSPSWWEKIAVESHLMKQSTLIIQGIGPREDHAWVPSLHVK